MHGRKKVFRKPVEMQIGSGSDTTVRPPVGQSPQPSKRLSGVHIAQPKVGLTWCGISQNFGAIFARLLWMNVWCAQ